jgi:hypothetical protein
MARRLTKLRITEVGSVKRGAGIGVDVVLGKRDETEKGQLMTKLEALRAIAKRNGIVNVAKAVLENDDLAKGISEHEFVAMLTEAAIAFQREHESETQSFARMFAAQTPEGLLLRQAHNAVKIANRLPMVVTEQPVSKGEDTAYEQLVAKANKLRAFDPSLSFHQAFERVFSNPVNKKLAEQERSENRPVSTEYPPGGERQ